MLGGQRLTSLFRLVGLSSDSSNREEDRNTPILSVPV